MKAKKGDMVEVLWRDAASPHGTEWMAPNETIRSVKMRSVAYIHEISRSSLVLVQNVEPNHVQGLFAIPRTAIRKVRRLKRR